MGGASGGAERPARSAQADAPAKRNATAGIIADGRKIVTLEVGVERRARRLLRNRAAIDRRTYEEKCNGGGTEIETAG